MPHFSVVPEEDTQNLPSVGEAHKNPSINTTTQFPFFPSSLPYNIYYTFALPQPHPFAPSQYTLLSQEHHRSKSISFPHLPPSPSFSLPKSIHLSASIHLHCRFILAVASSLVSFHHRCRFTFRVDSPALSLHTRRHLTFHVDSPALSLHTRHRLTFHVDSPSLLLHTCRHFIFRVDSPSVSIHHRYRLTLSIDSP